MISLLKDLYEHFCGTAAAATGTAAVAAAGYAYVWSGTTTPEIEEVLEAPSEAPRPPLLQ